MRLDQLLDEITTGENPLPDRQVDIVSIRTDSRKVKQGDLFVALKGSTHNGVDFIEEAIERGASTVATSQNIEHLKKVHPNITFLTVNDTKDFLHQITEVFYEAPSSKVRVIGITGTNGKTTVSYLIESIFLQDKKECGVSGTVNYRRGNHITPATQTTPDYIDNQKFLANLVNDGIPYSVMEVSSHALNQDRVHGINFCTAVFTNLTGDHLDYHKSIDDYFLAKTKLFINLSPKSTAVINVDDKFGQKIPSMTKAKVFTFGIHQSADVMAQNIESNVSGSMFNLSCPNGTIEISTQLIGQYNIYNILAAASVSLAEGISLDVIKRGIEEMVQVPGRFERIDQGQDYSVFVDYAHTQDALANVLTALRQISQSKIILVFGCGGDRDRSKRSLMGHVASQMADFSIVTSDNPRSEDPQSIIDEIIPGFDKNNYKIVVNRKEAIEQALSMAQTGDIVLITGKGHETTQVNADGRIIFNEREILENYLSC